MTDSIAAGHTFVADVLFLIAAILFGLATLLAFAGISDRGVLVRAGATLFAVAWLVL